MQIFITGASGFIGGAVAKSLANKHTIRAMSRSTKNDEILRNLGATPVHCELGSVQPDDIAGCEVVIHCAAFVKQWGTREEFWAANVKGTAQLLNVASRTGVSRFIHIGTEAALYYGQNMLDIDETYPYPTHTPFLYPETKAEAEKLVLAANAPDFMTISLRPRFVWGPGDQTIMPVVKRAVERGMYMWINQGHAQTSTTHIDNLVHAVELSLTHGRGGQAYFITDGSNTTVREILTSLANTQGLRLTNLSLPTPVARALGWLIERFWRLFRINSDPPLTHFSASMASSDCTVRIDKARAELEYSPIITREQGLGEMKEQE